LCTMQGLGGDCVGAVAALGAHTEWILTTVVFKRRGIGRLDCYTGRAGELASKRERQRERQSERERESVCVCV
jgi:hypothetical protein